MKSRCLKNYIAHNFLRMAQRLNKLGKHMAEPLCPGTITVAGKNITDLVPMGGYHKPGITKAGRLSFSGRCDGRKVKLYSLYSAEQGNIRIAFQQTYYGKRYFPEIIAHDQTCIVEEWIDGVSFKKLGKAFQEQGFTEIRLFLSKCIENEELIQLAENHHGAFCYFKDYLIKRLEPWQSLDSVREFLGLWQDAYDKVKNYIPLRLSHPDLSANNILRENETGRIVVVDNELLGVGHGWVLDGKNSILNKFFGIEYLQETRKVNDFLNLSWQLRQLGSMLDVGDFKNAYLISSEPDFEG